MNEVARSIMAELMENSAILFLSIILSYFYSRKDNIVSGVNELI